MSQQENVLPLTHQQPYATLQKRLVRVDRIVLLETNNVTLQSEVAALQQFFRDQLLTLPMDALSSATQHWVQSYQVEIDKQLRLLGMDALFLQAAKQAETAAQRQQQVSDRLKTLQRYCEALLGEEMEEERGEE